MKTNYGTLIDQAIAILKAQADVNPENNRVYNQLAIMRQKMHEGSVKIESKSDYWIFWRGLSSFTLCEGYSDSDAMSRAGYGAGAMAALDFIMAVPKKRDAVYGHVTLPDAVGDDVELFSHYEAHTWMFLDDLQKENASADDMADAVEEVKLNAERLEKLYPGREFTNRYAAMYNELFLKFGKIPTGWVELDKHLEGGLRPGDFTIVRAATSEGASSFVGGAALEDAEKKKEPELTDLERIKVGMAFVDPTFFNL